MATTKLKFRASSVSGKQGTLFIQVIHKRVVRQFSTDYRLYSEEWDAARQSVVVPKDIHSERIRYLHAVQEALKRDMSRLQLIILALDHSRMSYLADDVVRRFLKKEHSDDVIAFAEMLVGKKRVEGYNAIAAKYQTSIDSFKRFMGDRLLTFEGMDASLMLSYETYLKRLGLCPNTTSFYMRNLRAIYNQAVEQGLTAQQNPFAHVYTGIAKTVKRAVNAEEIRKLKALILPPDSADDLARDIFLFSLYTCGMSLIDIAKLKKSDIQGKYLSYCRQKTGQRIYIRWEPCMQQLVDKYQSDDSPYLLPLITRTGQDEMKQYQNKIHLINHHLKKLGKQLELTSKLTSYVARHSWASIAKSQDVSVSAISAAMGHTSERTTRIYLKSFDNTLVDCANKKVLSSIA
ncbi:MAG: site-specific integrase [Prevotella sp.]